MSSKEKRLIKYMIISTLVLFCIIILFNITRNILDDKNESLLNKINIKEKKLKEINEKNKPLEKKYNEYKKTKKEIHKYNDEVRKKINEKK